jgi:hypothetical protein
MPSPQEIVSEIESYLASRDGERLKELTGRAAAYAVFCRAANDRLRRCADYLRRGLRSEAIYHAEINPDLLQLVGALDFSRFDEWDEVCQKHGLDRAPRLMLDVAKRINEAYVVEAPLRELLAKLRLMALAKVPVRYRLQTLRTVAKADPNNLVWDEDIKVFERSRLDHIGSEVAKAVENNDRDALEALLREEAESPWRIPVPLNLAASIRGNLRKVQVTVAVRELEALLPKLHEAHAALDYQQASALVQQWQQIVAANDLTVPDAIQSQAQPILAWVAGIDAEQERQRQFGAACAQLDRALEGKTSMSDLRKLHRTAASLEQAIPAELGARYAREMEGRELARSRRVRLALVVSILFALGTAAAVTIVIRSGMEGYRAGVRFDAISQAIEAAKDDPSQLEVAAKEWADMEQKDPPLLQRQEMGELKQRLAKAVADEADRARQFRFFMDKAAQAGAKTPDDSALKKAEQLAKASSEKLEVVDLQAKIDEFRKGVQRERDTAFLAKVNAIAEEIRTKLAPERLRSDLSAYGQTLGDLESRLALLRQERGISSDVMDNATGLERQLTALRPAHLAAMANLSESQREKADLDGLSRRGWSAAELAKALSEFLVAHPSSTKAAAFKQARERATGWMAVDEWAALISSDAWMRTLLPRKASEVPDRLKAIDAYAEKHKESPFAGYLKEYKDFLEKGAAAVADAGPWKSGLRSLTNLPVMRDLWSFQVAGGKVYYCIGNGGAKGTSAGRQVTVVKSNDCSKTEQITFGPEQLPTNPQESPQLTLGAAIANRLGTLTVDDWHVFGIEVAELIRNDKATDAILRVTLLSTVLTSIKESGWNVPEEIESSLTVLEAQDLGEAIWVDPDNTVANAMRPRVQGVLTRLPSLASAKTAMHAKRQAILDRLLLICADRAVALKDENGAWQVRMCAGGVTEGRVIAVVPAAGGKSGLREVGTVKGGKVSLVNTVMLDVPEGSMLFICDPATKVLGR